MKNEQSLSHIKHSGFWIDFDCSKAIANLRDQPMTRSGHRCEAICIHNMASSAIVPPRSMLFCDLQEKSAAIAWRRQNEHYCVNESVRHLDAEDYHVYV